ncbi:glycosyltransferase [Baekduia sp.]|jgi:glycosyltransferase involved in cell wall biosynthesis/predicted metal-dependent phosphoesterase TrpH|uniref:glycosyltransferase n=1 Tax=Baekduia sp. TaxID=2600305 RepID=UPI002DFB4CD8|nr:glycosyltransferase [Baekduia sp.]
MRADLHCHSTASQRSKLGVQRALGLPECATPPQEVLELALARGMDFVTITDHDTIDGVLEIADDPRVFISVELTCWFREEPQAVHVLCLGITPAQFADLQAISNCVESVAEHLHEHDITCALAHPFYAVEAPLTPRHRRRLAQLFGAWEVRNGARAKELNLPAFVYVETHGGTGVGGSDDHAGVDIGRTWTETPRAETPEEFLSHIRAGRAHAAGDHGSAAKWAHAAMALAVRSLDRGGAEDRLDPATVLRMVERVMSEGDARRGAMSADLAPQDARALLRAWLDAVELGHLDSADLLAAMQDDEFRHRDLFRRARRAHERKLARAVDDIVAGVGTHGAAGLAAGATQLFDACVAAIPYAPAAAFLGKEKSKLAGREDEPRRVALVADGVGGMHGVTHTLQELRHRGVPGFEVEVVSTDLIADRRLGAVAEVEIPFYAGLKIGVPSLPTIVEALAEGRYDLVHLCTPGPAGVAALLTARVMDLPVLGSYHTELAAYAGLRSADPTLEAVAQGAMAMFYSQCSVVLSPSDASDTVLGTLGIPADRVGRWDRGVDLARFSPNRRVPGMFGDGINVLYAGRLTREKGADLLADAFLEARERDPRLHLVLAGGGPEEEVLRDRLGEHATFLGWLEGDALADAYASADLFLFASRTDTFGQVLLEAQASGLPVVAVAEGGPCSIVADGATGLLCSADATALADAVVALAADPDERARLAGAARHAVADRTWERALERLADGYRRALGDGVAEASGETAPAGAASGTGRTAAEAGRAA